MLFGKVNPAARLPFTIAKARSDYNADVVYENPGNLQITYSEGLNIDCESSALFTVHWLTST